MSGERHKTTFMSELNDGQGADIDSQLVPMVKFLNRMSCKTTQCCQGEPGILAEGGCNGYVMYVIPDHEKEWEPVCRFTFDFLRPFVAHLGDDVSFRVDIFSASDDDNQREVVTKYWGGMSFRNEAIEEITKRFGVYCEMNHR